MKAPNLWIRLKRAARMLRSDEAIVRETIKGIDEMRPTIERLRRS